MTQRTFLYLLSCCLSLRTVLQCTGGQPQEVGRDGLHLTGPGVWGPSQARGSLHLPPPQIFYWIVGSSDRSYAQHECVCIRDRSPRDCVGINCIRFLRGRCWEKKHMCVPSIRRAKQKTPSGTRVVKIDGWTHFTCQLFWKIFSVPRSPSLFQMFSWFLSDVD